MVQILNVFVAFAVFANAFAIPILETRDIATEYTGSDTSSLTLKVSRGHGRLELEARGKNARNTKKKPQTTIGKVINGVQKYAKQCHFIRDEETGDVLIRELDEGDEDGGAIMYARDPAGTFGKIFKAAKGIAHRCQFIRSDETDEIYVREINEVEVGNLDARGNQRKGKTGLGKVITGAKALAQRCHFMRELEEEEMRLLARRSPGSTLGSVLKKVKGIAHRCHFIRDGEEDLGLD